MDDDWPLEFAMDELEPLVMRDPVTWLAAFLQFADQARLLPVAAKSVVASKSKLPAASGRGQLRRLGHGARRRQDHRLA